jgi:serine/threonine protein kinase
MTSAHVPVSWKTVPADLHPTRATDEPTAPGQLETNADLPLLLERRERYAVFDSIASGGMASVHLGVGLGALGFSRLVAIKRLHAQFARNERFVNMLLEEARLAARVRHVNVVQIHDVLEVRSEVFVVMEYVRGLALADLVRLQTAHGAEVPPRFAVPILAGALRGLHAAHESTDWDGTSLMLVHRDFSPQNILVGIGGVPRVIDFGFAQALGRGDVTREDEFKGKLAYAAPEQLNGGRITRQTDIFSAGIILWELIAGRRLFLGANDSETFGNVLRSAIVSPLDARATRGLDRGTRRAIKALAPIALRALDRDQTRRYPSALEMAAALESACVSATPAELGKWVERLGAERLAREHQLVRRIERAVASGELIRSADAELAPLRPLPEERRGAGT